MQVRMRTFRRRARSARLVAARSLDRVEHDLSGGARALAALHLVEAGRVEVDERGDDLLGLEPRGIGDRGIPRRPGGRQALARLPSAACRLVDPRRGRERRFIAAHANRLAADVRAPAKELLDLTLVAVRLADPGQDRAQPRVLAELQDGLA